MIVLSIDTCDWRGSVAVLEEEAVVGVLAHETKEEYSSWLLPAVGRVLGEAGLRMAEVGGYAVAAGPGSFTGVRVGLTSVKAWAEVYGKPVASVSRLEAFASEASRTSKYVAAFVDAQRGQVFGAVYRQDGSGLAKISEEMVIAPARFVGTAVELANAEKITWASPDAHLLTSEDAWREREKCGESIERISATLAGTLGRIGLRLLKEGKTTDAVALDANYVRRSDAEIFWKGGPAHGR
ncbi:MAG TPA: tRNA (adenosine(37)-N6)-threonylcarbamoyltransferase complex dimerization subunit type 1 TsaB [Candidatus Acidoferrum sp.]|nr:tRNA (adenosine(37)-N6)-threonylcarbamoyltransferase complex dimerization subunit type 1 TsaB [Candidatus Acidoferrum sp.]